MPYIHDDVMESFRTDTRNLMQCIMTLQKNTDFLESLMPLLEDLEVQHAELLLGRQQQVRELIERNQKLLTTILRK